MIDYAFIIFNQKGVIRLVKGRQSKYVDPKRPALGAGEYAIFATFDIPDSVFQPRPTASATIAVSEEKILSPIVDVVLETPPAE